MLRAPHITYVCKGSEPKLPHSQLVSRFRERSRFRVANATGMFQKSHEVSITSKWLIGCVSIRGGDDEPIDLYNQRTSCNCTTCLRFGARPCGGTETGNDQCVEHI